MPKVYRLDLHTHPISALREQMGIKGIGDISKDVAAEIVRTIKAAGLNGIAITEKNNFNHGWVACLQIMDFFKSENLIIIPGVEIDYQGIQLLQLYIPIIYRKRMRFFNNQEWFWILANPGLINPVDLKTLEPLKIDSVEGLSLKGKFDIAGKISQKRNIPVIQASDSIHMSDIGSYYMEL
jgi:hypothetical protein